MKTCLENVGLMCHPETLEDGSWLELLELRNFQTGRIASVRTGSKILRFYGFLLNENPDGSNSINVRIIKA